MKKVCTIAFALSVLFCPALTGQGVERVQESKTTYKTIIDMLRNEPGLTIIGSGEEGVMPKTYIRGIGTTTDQYQPLFVVDGLKTDDIMYVTPENVYSIKVIKDGTTAIYGMEGANGVIEIRTKGAVESEMKSGQDKKVLKKEKREKRKSRKAQKRQSPAPIDSIS